MKYFLTLILCLGAAGCAANFDSSVLEIGGHVDSPFISGGKKLPVVFPYRADDTGNTTEKGMVGAYGPVWNNLQEDYPEYRFN